MTVYSQLSIEYEREEAQDAAYKEREQAHQEINDNYRDAIQAIKDRNEEQLDELIEKGHASNIKDWTIVQINIAHLTFGSTIMTRRQGRYCYEINEWLVNHCDDDVFLFEYEFDKDYQRFLSEKDCEPCDEEDTRKKKYPDYNGNRVILIHFKNPSDALKCKLAWC